MNPPKPFSQPQNNANQRLGPTSAGSGWSSSPSTSASQQSWSQSPQSQNNSSQRLGPTSTASGWSSISSTSANQKPWTQPPRSVTRPPVENRWAGKPLATTAMFTDDFFSTAKPRTQAPSTTSLSSAVDRQNQVQSQTSNGWSEQGSMDSNLTQKQDFTTNHPGFSAESKSALARWQMYEQQQQEQQQQEREQEQEQQGQQQQPSQRQPHQPSQPPTHRSYQQQIRGSPTNGHKKELSNAWPVEDGGSTTYPQPSAVNSESGRTSRMDAGSDIPDDPLFLQYPIGDGCHVVVAMYVERTAEAAANRFPTMTRKRQESSWKQKSVDEVATIFKQALTEEKKDVTG
ncbi:hypothetical protein BGZ75_005570 [Mortierella antarctica]|nr:hypothetical protein BGZ75_005570 [Mortierella antarctica]